MKPRVCCLAFFALAAGPLFGQLQGNFDSANCGSITGWASNGSSIISVDFYDSATYLTTVTANSNTGSDSYVDGAYHGFYLATPTTLKDNRVHTIYARYGGTTTNIGSVPTDGGRTIQCDSSSTGYQYYYTDTFQSINASNWTQNGTLSVLATWGLSATTSGGGSLISKLAVQGPSTVNYEVNTTLALNASGGVYVQYLRANSNALTGTGSYYSVELQNPTFNVTTGACSATLAGYQSINSSVTQVFSTPVVCRNGMQIRTVVTGSYALTTVNGLPFGFSFSSQLSSGMPGIGGRSMPTCNAISLAELGPWDNVAPSPVNANSFTPWITTGMVQVEWEGAVDNSNGVGVGFYDIYRTDGGFTMTSPQAAFVDTTVQPGTSYTYQVSAVDYHGNASAATNLAATIPTSSSTPNLHGLRPTNSYWGGLGEQIDIYGGNLNYSVPLINAIGRGGLQAAFNLTYNSQNWVSSGSTSFIQNQDVGYGFGWQLMLGAVMPIYGSSGFLEYWYTNASGAQFRMTINNGGVFTGNASFYAWYDSNANILHFRDGSFWVMGCVSAGGEPDAGTLYPTLIEDSNGNQIIVHYMAGAGASWIDSSARIMSIEDARAVSYTDPGTGDQLYHSYAFTYRTAGNGLSYLSGITSYVGTVENYSFTINSGQGIYSPLGASFGTASLLAGITVNGLYSYGFTYDTTLNDGDLTEVQFPQGGHLRWTYANCGGCTFTYRQVQNRYLETNTQQGEETYAFTPGNGSSTTLDDPTGAERYWVYNGTWLSEIQYRPSKGGTPVRHEYYTWVQNPTSQNYYIGTLKTVLDEGQPYTQTTETIQTQDSYGNVTSSQVYDYGNLSAPARSYSNTYLSNANYTSRYIYNRLLTSTLTSVTPNVTLASNTYDGGTLTPTYSGPREWDANYGAWLTYRGNVTQANTPGKNINTSYDYTGTVVSQNDNNGHSVNVATSTATNYTLPDTLSPNGSTSLQTQAGYASPGYAPASIAAPGQTLNNGISGTAAFTAYDSYGRVSYTLAPAQSASGTGAQTNYTYAYASSGWTITATTASSGGASHYTTTTLDGIGRTSTVQTGNGSTVVSTVDTSYAPCACGPVGKMYQKSQPYAPGGTEVYTTYTYDALGRTINVLLADGASHTTYAYQGNFTTVTDPAGNWKQYATDAFGNLVMVLEPDPTQHPVVGPPAPSTYPVSNAPSGTLLTTYTYDQYNHLTQVSMPRNTANGMKTQTRTFVYNPTTYSTVTLPALWITSATNPESGTVSYTYNADGTLASKTDANGNTETYTYDAYQRLTGIPDRNQTFTYDTCPSGSLAMGCVSMPGQLAQATFGSMIGPNELSFEYNYAYTPAGRVSSKTLVAQSANHLGWGAVQAYGSMTASYAYDNQGALTSMAYPAQENWGSQQIQTFTYTLDAMERPTGMTDNLNNTWASGATYNAASQPLYDGTATRAYNNLLQMTSMVATGMSMTYNYSSTQNNGQITSSVDGISGETVTYIYDALKRLVAGQGKTWTESYTYDGYGNLTQMLPTGGAPSLSVSVALDSNNVPTNRISATGVTYDSNGNQTAGFGGLTFTYDKANRITAVGGSQSAAYAYDANNLRVYSRSASGAETVYFYGADGRKLATFTYEIITYIGEPEIQFVQQSENVYFLGKLISAEGNTVQTDRLGSVRSGGPGGLGHQAQFPYGVEYTVTANDREKYATYTRDSATGMDYAMNRYYSSQWGRFLSPDPYLPSARLRFPGSWNRYAYVGGDPVGRRDRRGLGSGPVDCGPEDSDCVILADDDGGGGGGGTSVGTGDGAGESADGGSDAGAAAGSDPDAGAATGSDSSASDNSGEEGGDAGDTGASSSSTGTTPTTSTTPTSTTSSTAAPSPASGTLPWLIGCPVTVSSVGKNMIKAGIGGAVVVGSAGTVAGTPVGGFFGAIIGAVLGSSGAVAWGGVNAIACGLMGDQ